MPGALRRARALPRNKDGEIICDHPNCRDNGNNTTFKRVCEWNKHMDRHERPYKCHEAGCELNPGFTYSGGLLRHQREVHKMHLSTKEPLFCPFPNCNRSSGSGFTRRENLEEHKRRRHMDDLGQVSEEQQHQHQHQHPSSSNLARAPSQQQQQAPVSGAPDELAPPAKRRRTQTPNNSSATATATATTTATVAGGASLGQQQSSTSSTSNTSQNVQVQALLRQTGMTEHQLIEHLQSRLREKEECIRRQAAELEQYQTFFQALPPQAIYNVVQPQISQISQVSQLSQLPGTGG
ncbi:hypothetical protein LTR20_006528 [Exophiala xenobiotica]|nr:hypothetical protein LTS13_008172 [Exophiala xenobiotica]KAK5395029.1 hypothetical protein LTR79_007645 [Exophiala xenobiotica]KAK5412970.1 hypothetical protein LTR90_007092 [Exophiala xenobiotica]KAK5461604.1 hypothetical protein LTR20_006528 [Exophiala xenobiotica]KAK5482288.1 hypothetical protein LTR26_006622 [Exophiala xenobiotica]